MKQALFAGFVAFTLLGAGTAAGETKLGASQRVINALGMQTLLSAIAIIGPTAGTAIAIQQAGYLVTGVTEQSGGARLMLRPAAGGADIPVEISGLSPAARSVASGARVDVVARTYGSALISADGVVLGIFVDDAARGLMHSSRSFGR